jgi:enoyl-CoA hydratase/carnithine racemase
VLFHLIELQRKILCLLCHVRLNINLECKIGFFTDVAGGYFLSRLRNNIGYYIGLTGARLKGEQVYQAGLANYFIPK